jgi:hypothetical protein
MTAAGATKNCSGPTACLLRSGCGVLPLQLHAGHNGYAETTASALETAVSVAGCQTVCVPTATHPAMFCAIQAARRTDSRRILRGFAPTETLFLGCLAAKPRSICSPVFWRARALAAEGAKFALCSDQNKRIGGSMSSMAPPTAPRRLPGARKGLRPTGRDCHQPRDPCDVTARGGGGT